MFPMCRCGCVRARGRGICCRRSAVDCSRSLSLAFHVGVKLSSSLESHRWHLSPRTSLNSRVVRALLLPPLLPSVTVHSLSLCREDPSFSPSPHSECRHSCLFLIAPITRNAPERDYLILPSLSPLYFCHFASISRSISFSVRLAACLTRPVGHGDRPAQTRSP